MFTAVAIMLTKWCFGLGIIVGGSHTNIGITAATTLSASPSPAIPGAGQAACVLPGHTSYPFCNTSLDLDARVYDLIQRIHDDDKPNLLTARGCRDCDSNDGDDDGNDALHRTATSRGPGHMQALPYLGVPEYYWGQNCLHSALTQNCTADGRCATNFPSGPSMAATFDTDLIREAAGVISTELRAAFNAKTWTDNGANGIGLECWGPVINLNRSVGAGCFVRFVCALLLFATAVDCVGAAMMLSEECVDTTRQLIFTGFMVVCFCRSTVTAAGAATAKAEPKIRC